MALNVKSIELGPLPTGTFQYRQRPRKRNAEAAGVPDKLVDLEEVKATSDPGEFRFGVAESANGNASPQTLRACPTEAR